MAVPHEKHAPRVSVLDAKELDVEILGILRNQWSALISHLPPGSLSRFDPEIQAALRFILWKLSVEKSSATFGQQLLSLKYSEHCPKSKLRTLAILNIGSSYLKERLHHIVAYVRNPYVAESIISTVDHLETAYKILSAIAFIAFLRGGSAPTFLECILGLKPVSIAGSSRSVGYSFMTRELLWHGFIEMLVFMIPLVNYHSLKRRVKRWIVGKEQVSSSHSEILYTGTTVCSLCRQIPVVPHQMGCSHVYCYYCLSASRLADEGFECVDCGHSDPDPGSVIPVTLLPHTEMHFKT